MNLHCINTYLTGRFMYKIYHKEVPDIFDDLFMYNYHIHDYYTRVSSHLHVPLASTNLSKTGIRNQGVIVWNNILTADINPDCSELFFKVMLKNVLTRNCYRFKSIIKLCIFIHNLSTALYLELAALAPPALVLFLFSKYTCSTVKGPINRRRFLAPFCHFIWWFLCTLFDVKLASYTSVLFLCSFCIMCIFM